MNAARGAWTAVICGLSMLAVGACATSRTPALHGASFTRAAIREGGLAVGGVTFVSDRDLAPSASSVEYAGMLHEALLTGGGVPLAAAPEAVGERFGVAAMNAVLREHRQRGELTAVSLDTLATALDGVVRFLVFARVESDTVRQSRTEKQDPVGESGAWAVTGYELSTTREVGLACQVYDLRSRAPVWESSQAGRTGNSIRYALEEVEEPEEEDDRPLADRLLLGAMDLLIDAMIPDGPSPPEPKFPEVPPLEDPFRAACETFVEALASDLN